MNEQEREQNQKINEHNRKIANLQQRLKTIELDVVKIIQRSHF